MLAPLATLLAAIAATRCCDPASRLGHGLADVRLYGRKDVAPVVKVSLTLASDNSVQDSKRGHCVSLETAGDELFRGTGALPSVQILPGERCGAIGTFIRQRPLHAVFA